MLPVYEPTAEEWRAIEEGRAEIERGEFVYWAELEKVLGFKSGSSKNRFNEPDGVSSRSLEPDLSRSLPWPEETE